MIPVTFYSSIMICLHLKQNLFQNKLQSTADLSMKLTRSAAIVLLQASTLANQFASAIDRADNITNEAT